MLEAPLEFIDIWNRWAKIVALVALGFGLIVYLRYWFRFTFSKDPKVKYDLINLKEISTLRSLSIFLIIALALFANSFIDEIGAAWMVIRSFVTLCLSVIIGVIISNMLKFYYPFYVEKRLRKLRYKPRISPKTGKAMKLLSEEEEDVYLDEGMQAEENVFSVDYDVWVDEETGFTKIEKYAGHLHAQKCPECNYQTFRTDKEEIVQQPTETEEGELIKYMECGYCGHKETKRVKVAKIKETGNTEAAPAV